MTSSSQESNIGNYQIATTPKGSVNNPDRVFLLNTVNGKYIVKDIEFEDIGVVFSDLASQLD